MKQCISRAIVLILVVWVSAGCGRDVSQSSETPGVGFTPNEITLREVPGSDLKELVDPGLVFEDAAGVEWFAPRGTRTDGASVPRLALWVTDGRFDREFLKGAVVHDAHCQTDNETRCPDEYRTKPWKDVHRMFYEACLAGGTSPTKARLMFAAVWLGGPRWDDPDRNLEKVPDDKLKAVFERCKVWIQENDPTIDEIEAWMDEREQHLLRENQ